MLNDTATQLKKGVLEILVLKILKLKDMYGYEIIQSLDTGTEGIFKVKEGTLYPILYRLEDEKLIESYWENGEKRKVPRKYYKITDAGENKLIGMMDEWNKFLKGANMILLRE